MILSKAYEAGFCKAAEDLGVDPEQLVKHAGGMIDSARDSLADILQAAKDGYSALSPDMKRALVGGAAASAGTYLGAYGDRIERLKKAILFGGLAGAGIYGFNKAIG